MAGALWLCASASTPHSFAHPGLTIPANPRFAAASKMLGQAERTAPVRAVRPARRDSGRELPPPPRPAAGARSSPALSALTRVFRRCPKAAWTTSRTSTTSMAGSSSALQPVEHDQGRVHVRLRIEDGAGQLPGPDDAGVEPHPHREGAVGLGPRSGGHAVGHLALHHEAVAAHAGQPLQRLDDERPRHRVGQVAGAQGGRRIESLQRRP